MEWITAGNKKFLKNEAIALDITPENEGHHASLVVFLRGGATLTINESDATRIWNEFTQPTAGLSETDSDQTVSERRF